MFLICFFCLLRLSLFSFDYLCWRLWCLRFVLYLLYWLSIGFVMVIIDLDLLDGRLSLRLTVRVVYCVDYLLLCLFSCGLWLAVCFDFCSVGSVICLFCFAFAGLFELVIAWSWWELGFLLSVAFVYLLGLVSLLFVFVFVVDELLCLFDVRLGVHLFRFVCYLC